jgi:hypothetical protein
LRPNAIVEFDSGEDLRSVRHGYCRYGLELRSRPIVVNGPWPGITRVASL